MALYSASFCFAPHNRRYRSKSCLSSFVCNSDTELPLFRFGLHTRCYGESLNTRPCREVHMSKMMFCMVFRDHIVPFILQSGTNAYPFRLEGVFLISSGFRHSALASDDSSSCDMEKWSLTMIPSIAAPTAVRTVQ